MKSSDKTRILIFVDWFEPGFRAGGMLRSMNNMVEHLREDYEFFIVTRDRDYLTNRPFSNIAPDCWTAFSPGVKVWYARKNTLTPRLWIGLIGTVNPVTVYINGIFSFWYSVLPLLIAKSSGRHRMVVAPSGMMGEAAISIKSWKKWPFIIGMRAFGIYRQVIWHAASIHEKKEIYDIIGGSSQILVAPLFSSGEFDGTKSSVNLKKQKNYLKLCYISRITKKKNLLYALEVLGKMGGTMTIEMNIFGPVDDLDYWQKCQKYIGQLPGNIKVDYAGEIAHSQVQKKLSEHHALFLPTMHENYGYIIPETFGAGRPVIISDFTPWRHLRQKNAGWDISLDNQDEFVRVITSLAAQSHEGYEVYCKGAAKMGMEISEQKGLTETYKELLG